VVREAVVLLPEPPDTLNPLYARSWSARALQDLFLAGLWRQDDRLGLVPELAAEVPTRANGGISEDGLTITIRLRDDVFWSDGEPLTGADVVFTYEMALAEGNDLPTRFPYDGFVDEVAAPEARTVLVRLARPFAPWPTALFPFVLPRHVLEPVFAHEGALDLAVWNRVPSVSSGPFVYARQEGGDLLFEANPRYWRGGPGLDRVRVRVVAEMAARWAALGTGTADFAPLLWPEAQTEMLPPGGVRLLTSASGYIETLLFNLDPRTGHSSLQEPRVRAALAQALVREQVCAALPGGQALPAATLVSGTVFEDPALATPVPSPEQAGQRLDEAGWRDEDGDGVRERAGVALALRYMVPEGEVDRAAVQALVTEMFAGVGVRLQEVPPDAGPPWASAAGWDVAQWAAQPPGYPDPDDPRWLCVEARPDGANPAGVCDEDLDRLLVTQAATTDPDARAALLLQVQERARQEAWWVPLCRWQDAWAVSERLSGPRPWRGGPFWNVWEWQVDS
jgi:peptide/nickel transport system substrate-binding protein